MDQIKKKEPSPGGGGRGISRSILRTLKDDFRKEQNQRRREKKVEDGEKRVALKFKSKCSHFGNSEENREHQTGGEEKRKSSSGDGTHRKEKERSPQREGNTNK